MATAMAKEMATARATMKEGLPLHVVAMCSAFRRATPCLHPHGHKESSFTSAASWGWHCKECLLPFKGEGPWQLSMECFLFIIYSYCLVYWTSLCLPPALFRHSRTLSAHWHSTSSTPPRTPSAYWRSTPAPIARFVKVSPGRACNDYNVIFCVDIKWPISHLFPKL